MIYLVVSCSICQSVLVLALKNGLQISPVLRSYVCMCITMQTVSFAETETVAESVVDDNLEVETVTAESIADSIQAAEENASESYDKRHAGDSQHIRNCGG